MTRAHYSAEDMAGCAACFAALGALLVDDSLTDALFIAAIYFGVVYILLLAFEQWSEHRGEQR